MQHVYFYVLIVREHYELLDGISPEMLVSDLVVGVELLWEEAKMVSM